MGKALLNKIIKLLFGKRIPQISENALMLEESWQEMTNTPKYFKNKDHKEQ